MQLSTSAVALAALSVASASNVTLKVESSSDSINGNGLNPIHFGAGINGVLLSSSPQEFAFDPQSKTVYQPIVTGSGPVNFTFTTEFNELVTNPGNSAGLVVSDNYLTVNGSNSVFYACKNLTFDPYSYTKSGTPNGKNEFGVVVSHGEPSGGPSDCSPIKIKVTSAGGSGANDTTGPVTTSGFHNGTTTTVGSTAYTTIPCPSPTTLTYNSKTYTVTEATTLTVEDCGCTEKPGAPKPTAQATSSGNSTGIAPANGAAKAGFGAAAIAAGAVYLL